MIRIRYSILAGLLFAVIMFIYLSITTKIDIAIVISIFIFIISPFLFYFKMFSKVDFTTNFQKVDKKSVIYSGMSSHFKDGITVGGTLYLLNDRLLFQSNLINFIKRHEQTILLSQIAEVDTFDNMGFISNGLLIKNKNSENEKFVVSKSEIWKEQLKKQVTVLKENTNR